jgi:hypothetical protein
MMLEEMYTISQKGEYNDAEIWDYIAAKTAEDAVAQVCEKRPYVIAADAASLSQVQGIAREMKSRSIARFIHQFDSDTATPKE